MGTDVFFDLPDAAVIFSAGIHIGPGGIGPEILGQDVKKLEQASRDGQPVIPGIIQIFTGDGGEDPADRIVVPVRFQDGIAHDAVLRAGCLLDKSRGDPDMQDDA